MLIGPVLALLLVLLFYKPPVNTMGIGWNARWQNPGPGQAPASYEAPVSSTGEPMDLNDVFKRPSR